MNRMLYRLIPCLPTAAGLRLSEKGSRVGEKVGKELPIQPFSDIPCHYLTGCNSLGGALSFTLCRVSELHLEVFSQKLIYERGFKCPHAGGTKNPTMID